MFLLISVANIRDGFVTCTDQPVYNYTPIIYLDIIILQAEADPECLKNFMIKLDLQVSKSKAQLEGNFSVQCGHGKDLSRVPLCAEMLSRHLMQDMICSALGLQYTGIGYTCLQSLQMTL